MTTQRLLRYSAPLLLAQAFGLLLCFTMAWIATTLTYPSGTAYSAVHALHLDDRLYHTDVRPLVNKLSFIGHLQWLIDNAWYFFSIPTAIAVAWIWQKEGGIGKNILTLPASLLSEKTAKMVAVICAGIVLGVTVRASAEIGVSFVSGCIGLAWQVLFGVVGLFPISLILLAVLLATARTAPRNVDHKFLLCAVPLLMPILSIMWGAYFWYFTSQRSNFLFGPNTAQWAVDVLSVLLYTYIAASIALTVLYRGNRPFFAAAFACGLWIMLLCNFISGMAVTGVWL